MFHEKYNLYMRATDLQRKTVSALKWTSAGRFSGQAVSWISTIVVIRLLSPDDYGVMAIASVFVTLLTFISEAGLGASIITTPNITKRYTCQAFGVVLFFNIVCCVFLFFVSPYISSFYNDPRLVNILRVLSLHFLLTSLFVVPQALLQREMKFKGISIIEFISILLSSLITLVLALYGFDVWALVIGQLAMNFVKAIGISLLYKQIIFPIFNFRDMGNFFSFGGSVTVSRLLWFLYVRCDVLIISKVLGSEVAGFYAVSMELATLPMQKISGLINQVAFPSFSAIKDDLDKVANSLCQAIGILSIVVFPVLFGMSAVATELVSVLLGNNWTMAVFPLQVLSLLVPLRMISNIISPAMMGIGNANINLTNLIIASVVVPVAIYAGTFWGIRGVSVAWAVAYIPVFFIMTYRALILITDKPFSLLYTTMFHPVMASLIMYIVVIVLSIIVPIDNNIFRLLILVVSGASVYVCYLLKYDWIRIVFLKEALIGGG